MGKVSGEDEKAKEGLLPGKSCLWVLTLKFQGTPENKPDLSKYPKCSCFLKNALPIRWKHSVPETLDFPVGKVTPDTKRVFRKDLCVQTAGDGKQSGGRGVHTQRKCEGVCTREIKRIRLGRGSVGKSICCISMKSSLVPVTHRKVQICRYGCMFLMYVYVCACVHTCMCVDVYASAFACIPMCVYLCVCTRICMYLHVCMCT